MTRAHILENLKKADFFIANLKTRLFNLINSELKDMHAVKDELDKMLEITNLIKSSLEAGRKEANNMIIAERHRESFFEMLRHLEEVIRNSVVEESLKERK